MTLNEVKEEEYYLIIEPTQNSEELKEKLSKEQKKVITFEKFDPFLFKFFWPTPIYLFNTFY